MNFGLQLTQCLAKSSNWPFYAKIELVFTDQFYYASIRDFRH